MGAKLKIYDTHRVNALLPFLKKKGEGESVIIKGEGEEVSLSIILSTCHICQIEYER